MPRAATRTTVVVVTWRGAERIDACLRALAAQDREHDVLVLDNASDDGTAAVLADHPSAPEVLRLPHNHGYAGGLAAALERVRTPLMVWLNDDALPQPGWLAELEHGLTADVAAVTSRLYHLDGATQSLGVALTADGHGRDITAEDGVPFGFCGGAALLRVDALRAVGGVPAQFFCYYEDTDTSWRLRLAGWRVVTARRARVLHRHGASTRPGSAVFHRWNERNRLLVLLRCAPASVAARELAGFAALTLILPLRTTTPDAANFRFVLRARVLAEVLRRLPDTLATRREIGRRASIGRHRLWRLWAGR